MGCIIFFFVLKSICAAAAAAFSICFFSSLKLICAVAAFSHSSLQYCCYLIQFDQFNGSEKISYSSRGGIGYGSSSTTTGRPGTGNPYASVHVRAIEPSPLLTDSGVVPVRAPPTTAGKNVRLIRSLLPERWIRCRCFYIHGLLIHEQSMFFIWISS
jgi:hypothetical protein